MKDAFFTRKQYKNGSTIYFFFPFDFPFVTGVEATLEARDPVADVPLLAPPLATAFTALLCFTC